MGIGPGGLDCDEVIADVFLYLDDETDPDARQKMRQHLDDCAPCLRKYDLERTVKSLIQRSCAERAPAELRQKVLLRIQQVRVEITETYRTD